MPRYRKKLRILIGILKDTASITKTFLTTKRNTSKTKLVILQATSHNHQTSPPSENSISTVISIGRASRHSASACIDALMDRLHGTCNVYVAFKCLYIIHNINQKGSLILKDQLSFYPINGGRNFLNMSEFRDKSDNDTWELSSWVRWYASVIEQNLTVSRVLGYYLSSSGRKYINNNNNNRKEKEETVSGLDTGDLIREMEVLIGLVELICEAPENSTSIFQENGLVYEVVRLVCEDYGMTQKEILLRVKEIGERTKAGLGNYDELGEVLGALKRLVECRERLRSLFVNRKRNDAFWEVVEEVKGMVEVVVKKKEEMQLMVVQRGNTSNGFGELNPFVERQEARFASGRVLMLGLNRVPLNVSTSV